MWKDKIWVQLVVLFKDEFGEVFESFIKLKYVPKSNMIRKF